MNAEMKTITPSEAARLLKLNTNNRCLSERRVTALANSMIRGEWVVNGDTLRISKAGRLLDGQHRLNAVVRSGLPQTFFVIHGLDDEAFKTIDTGRARTPGDMLSTEGIPHYNTVASASSLYLKWKWTGNPVHGNPEKHPTHTQIVEFAKSRHDLLSNAQQSANSNWLRKYLSASSTAFLMTAFSEDSEYHSKTFFAELETGVVASTRSPTLLLRDRLMENKASKQAMKKGYMLALTFKAYKAHRDGRDVKFLRVRTEGDAPEARLFAL